MSNLLKKLFRKQSICDKEENVKTIEAKNVKVEIENLEEIADMKVIVDGEEMTRVVKIELQAEYASGRTFRNLVVERYDDKLLRQKIKIRI